LAGNFVGRWAILAQILGGDVGPGRASRFFVVQGIPGSGKTELLDQLQWRVEKGEGTPPGTSIFVRSGDYEVIGSRHAAQEFDEAAEFRQFKTLLQEVIPDEVEGATDAGPAGEGALVLPGLGGRSRARDGAPDPGLIIEQVTQAMTALAVDLARQGRRLVLLIDDFHLLASRPLGDWVLRWLTGIRGADIVLTNVLTPTAAAEPGPRWPSTAVPVSLGNLDYGDVARYLAAHPGVGPDVAEIIGPVWEFTGGHPQAMVLTADLIRENPVEAVRDIQRLHALEGGLARQLDVLVERLFRAIGDAELRDTLYSLCVTRHFDLALLTRLLEVSDEHGQTLIDQIRQFSFVTESDEGRFLRISDFVRRIGQVNHVDWTRGQRIHALAASYFHELIADETADDETCLQAGFHLEDRRFQTLEKNWLHHIGHLEGRRRAIGRLEIARTFLDGFWWWGCYAPFPFCEEILADWMSATAGDADDRAWGEALRAVYDSYPKGGRLEQAPRAQWVRVRRYLRYLWDQGGFERDSDDPLLRHLRGVADLFLVDALMYLNPADERVDECINDAVRQLAGASDLDDYMVAWLSFSRSDLALQRGQAEKAMELAVSGVQEHYGLGDYQMIACLHRLYADASWTRHEHARAFDGYARAVGLGYRAQVLGHPDDYTIAFQQEMIDRCLERIAELHADGGPARETAAAACERIRAFFQPYWDETGAEPVTDVAQEVLRALDSGRPGDAAALLFPAVAPEVDTDFVRQGTEWELICRDVGAEMADDLAQPPGTPLPAV
jgi:AAA ATPase domain